MLSSLPTLTWSAAGTPEDAQAMLRLLGEEYPFRAVPATEASLRLIREPGLAGPVVAREGALHTVRYGRLSQLGRALGGLLAGLEADASVAPAFDTLGFLLDCGHNASLTPAHFRKWLRRAALLGYNAALLYTEAGYCLPDEPAFGFQRGSYTRDEMRDLDGYASALGIELVGSIQALGHLEQVLKWPPYAGRRDTEHTLLVGDPDVAALVDKMVAFWAEACTSRRLHVGMDETYDLARGRYLDQHGYRPGLEVYTEHLRLVAEACERYGLRALVWSDVLFRLAGGTSHYDRNTRLPEAVREALPRNVDLVYWDYYSPDPQHYRDRITAHRDLGQEPLMASGIWSWPTPWHDWRRTAQFGGACVSACREAGLRELLFTLWSDDGGFWDVDSNLAGLALMAERCHGEDTVDEAALARRFAAVCGSDLAAHRAAARLNDSLQVCSVLWDDPLQALYLRHVAREGTAPLTAAAAHYAGVAADLQPYLGDSAAGDLGHAALVARVLAAKTGLAARLFEAYAAADRAALAPLQPEALALASLLEALAASYRRRWLSCCQPFGLEVLQVRFAGQAARYRELAQRLGEYLSGEIESLAEFEAASRGAFLPDRWLSYRALASAARVF